MRKIAAIDVDLTVVDIGTPWLEWLNNMSMRNLTLEDCNYEYNLGKYFENDLKRLSMRPCDYFRQCGLYDTLKPIEGSQEALEWLKGQGYDIVFVSHIKGNHNKSKHNFLRRYFPFMDGYLATKEKYFVRQDIFIDDRNDHINRAPEGCLKLKINSPYDQFEPLNPEAVLINKWKNFIPVVEQLL